MKPEVIIVCEGGLVRDVYTNVNGISVSVIDLDNLEDMNHPDPDLRRIAEAVQKEHDNVLDRAYTEQSLIEVY